MTAESEVAMKLVLYRVAIIWLTIMGSPCVAKDDGARLASEPNPPMLDYIVGRWEVEATDPKNGQVEKIGYEVQRFVGSAWVSGTAKSADRASLRRTSGVTTRSLAR